MKTSFFSLEFLIIEELNFLILSKSFRLIIRVLFSIFVVLFFEINISLTSNFFETNLINGLSWRETPYPYLGFVRKPEGNFPLSPSKLIFLNEYFCFISFVFLS